MIKLVLDSGNSSLKAAFWKNKKMVRYYRDITFAQLQQPHVLGQYGFPDAILFSTVSKTRRLSRQLTRNAGLVMLLDQNTRVPVKIRYKTPETLGNDRLANAVGAYSLFAGHPVLVIDAGTCLKFDMVDKDGDYLGGSISPGLQMRYDALHHYTARLPALRFQKKYVLTGTSTSESIIAGVQQGILSETEHMSSLYSGKYKGLKRILTGGDCRFFEGKLKKHIFVSPNLTLLGLNEILDFNLS